MSMLVSVPGWQEWCLVFLLGALDQDWSSFRKLSVVSKSWMLYKVMLVLFQGWFLGTIITLSWPSSPRYHSLGQLFLDYIKTVHQIFCLWQLLEVSPELDGMSAQSSFWELWVSSLPSSALNLQLLFTNGYTNQISAGPREKNLEQYLPFVDPVVHAIVAWVNYF